MWASRRKNRIAASAASYGIGVAAALGAAGAAFLFDPTSGTRRRALLRDRLFRWQKDSRDFMGKVGRDARQRTGGMFRGTFSRIRRRELDDRILADRVRSKLGRLSSHPRAIQVDCRDGVAHLRGDILERDLGLVLRGVRRVPGIVDVINELRSHSQPGALPALQGEGAHAMHRFEYMQDNWSPAPRVLAGMAAAALIVGGVARRNPLGYALAAGGAALLTRSICNRPLSRLIGLRSGMHEGVLVQKTIEVYAEVDEVYSAWRNLEQLPQFMTHLREVRRLDDRRYHWVVDGPAGSLIEWDSQITADVPNELIAWRTVSGSSVQSSGVVHFEPTSYGGTRIHVRMTYRPPANALGHTVAKIFGRDPKRQIDADMMRFKRFMETGAPNRETQTAVRH